jgi:uncharacterized protein YceK
MKKIILAAAVAMILSGCGSVDRFSASLNGHGSEVCQDGVIYLQFTSGTTVKYETNSSVATCVKGN